MNLIKLDGSQSQQLTLTGTDPQEFVSVYFVYFAEHLWGLVTREAARGAPSEEGLPLG